MRCAKDCRCCCEFLGEDPGYHGDCLVFLCSDCGARRGLEVVDLIEGEFLEDGETDEALTETTGVDSDAEELIGDDELCEVPYLCANELQEFRRKFADCKAQHAITYLLEHGWVCYRYEKGLHWWFLDHPWNPNWAWEDDFFAD